MKIAKSFNAPLSAQKADSGSGELESQHRNIVQNYTLVPALRITEPIADDERYVVRTFVTYGAYEDPI